MGIGDININFYIPDELIGQCCAAEYFGFLMSKTALNIPSMGIRDYLVYEEGYYENDDFIPEEFKEMVDSDLREKYLKLITKVKEITGIEIQLESYPEERLVIGGYMKDTNYRLNKDEKADRSQWSPAESFSIDKMLKFINILGYDSFEEAGVEVVIYEY